MKSVFVVTALLAISSLTMADLAAYWNFEDGSGFTASDSSGNGQNAKLMAGDGINYPQWTAGRNGSGGGLLFNTGAIADPNIVNYLFVDPNDIQSDPNVLDLGDAFTISMWVRRDAVLGTDWPYLVYTNAYDLELALDPQGTGSDLYDYLWSEASEGWQNNLGTETAAQTTLGNWYHLAVTYDKQVLRRYVNGELVFTSLYIAPGLPKATTGFYIGSRQGSGGPLTGALDDVAIWAGSYLPAAEVVKLASETATPLTVSDESPLPDNFFTKETNKAWTSSGWKLLYGPGFSTFSYWGGEDITLTASNTASAWWAKAADLPGWPRTTMIPGGRSGIFASDPAWFKFRDITPENFYGSPSWDKDVYGIEWIDPSWSGEPNNIAVFAPYITQGIALCLPNSAGYEPYNPVNNWMIKDYFKTYARVAVVNGAGASMRVKSYSYVDGTDPRIFSNLTYLGEVRLPLLVDDYVWKEFKFAYPKPLSGTPRVWTEISIVGGNENTKLYVDEFNPVSDQANTSQHAASYLLGDMDQDTVVNLEDIVTFSMDWLNNGDIEEPRNSGMLFNGDFYADLNLLDPLAAEPKVNMAPTGWTFTGPGGPGESGIYMAQKPGITNVGVMNYTNYVLTPLGGTVSAYTNEPGDILTQTTSENAVQGQTYYAMAYVMAKDWYGWKDVVTLSLEIDGTEVASFERPLSRNRWRPVYGSYTAVAADNGKPITVKISYANTHTVEETEPGIMFIGFVYLDNTMPPEWPDGRDNLLTNGGFEDLSALDPNIPPGAAAVAESIRKSDNWGAWFINDIPAPPGWLYEVPTGFNLANEGGMWASGLYGTPLPTPGMNDVCIYASGDLVLGQIVGPLTNGVTYYLDMACGINSSEYGSISWPTPDPNMHIELWRIPLAATDGDTIHTGITTSQPGYVKIAEAVGTVTGNISSGGGVDAAKWQFVGTTYTAAAADTNVYVRVYGTNGAAVMPEYAFSDVYLSTEKRLVPGGDITFDIDSGMDYDTAGPYTCTHANLMGLDAPVADLDGNCMVDINDLAILAGNWVQDWYTNISGIAPWE